jgi:quercetin dioxygenase-like cupin family protein
MAQTSVRKVNVANSPRGARGQICLAAGSSLGMRLWENEPAGEPKPVTRRDYETVGYVLAGRAELHIEEQLLRLEPGDSWVVPRGAAHSYTILEPFTAIEATAPPSHEQPE